MPNPSLSTPRHSVTHPIDGAQEPSAVRDVPPDAPCAPTYHCRVTPCGSHPLHTLHPRGAPDVTDPALHSL
eukprot:485883-Prorocentrum_lima.AAC.1